METASLKISSPSTSDLNTATEVGDHEVTESPELPENSGDASEHVTEVEMSDPSNLDIHSKVESGDTSQGHHDLSNEMISQNEMEIVPANGVSISGEHVSSVETPDADEIVVITLEDSDSGSLSVEALEKDDGSSEFSSTSFRAPLLDFKGIPYQITGVWKEFEVGSSNNYTKGCKWAPDGSCILCASEDAKMRLFNLPMELWQAPINWADVSEMTPALHVSEPELIYDYCWYPLMSSQDPVSCCFASSSRCNPVHMWDAFTGELRCTYRPYNHVDEIVASHSLAFDVDGQKLYCGFKNMIRIFDVSIPGRKCTEVPTWVKKYGQRGIISCFAFSAENRSVFAAGSYSKTVGIYSESDGSLIHLLDQQKGGLTHMCFSPSGYHLYCGGRKDSQILCWDLRDLKKPLFQLRRICDTNQRMYFDISRCGRYLSSGNENGVVSIWDVEQPPSQISVGDDTILEPVQFYQAHSDCVNGISFHPCLPLLVTSSGQRKFPEPLDSEGEESDGEMFSEKHIVKDNSIRLWWIGSCT